MGLVARQTFYNLLSIGLAFMLGAINTLYMYPNYMGSRLQGVVIALLAYSNLVQPFISFGLQHAIIKYYSALKTKDEKDSLLVFTIWSPLLILILISIYLWIFSSSIIIDISAKEPLLSTYAFVIILIAISTSYFEIFFSWLRVHLASVFGNFLKEFYPRLLNFILLTLYALNIIKFETFIYCLIIGYYIRLLLVILYSLKIYTPKFRFSLPPFYLKILFYSFLIFLSGAASSIILDIDKSMIASLITADDVAFYSVALFIAAVVEAPGRAMLQIVSPLVSKAINSNDKIYLTRLLKKSSNNLFLVSGVLFLLITLNLSDFYIFVNQPLYAVAIGVVSVVSIGKLYSMSIGCLNNIISNSKYYPYIFWFSILSATIAVILNLILIPKYGILGAAYATLCVIIMINTLKILLIAYGLKIHPYSKETLKILLVILVVYSILGEINFDSSSSLINLLIRSIVIITLYTCLSHLFGLFKDINQQINKYL
ncbi:MAG: oligosaccharide flippase family protein [Flavobacteriaceae bacterium]|nr:oligosaccharide flippase family protein [Flavobacteriaceae bacterium]